jgi:hypothetical protein
LRALVPALQAQFPVPSRSPERDLLVARTTILLRGETRRIGLRLALESPGQDARSGVAGRRTGRSLAPASVHQSRFSASRAVHPITGL